MSIQVLSPEVVNQIAAGEVVERPSHLVKELIENSIDARATKIEISFSQSGRQIEITDNGEGLTQDDLTKALARFATSKIKKSDDIWNLKTYGFRGEALASIAAVSDLLLTSRPVSQQQAYQIRCQFGVQSPLEKSGHISGTRIRVSHLFENVPARLKFLKSESAEYSSIKNTLKALALSHYEIEFKIFENHHLVYYWPSTDSYLARVQQVLEIPDLFLGQSERQGYQAISVFGSPQNVFKTTKNIYLFVQNRWVQDRSLQAAVMEAYRHLLMHKEFPVAVVWLSVPLDQVDVNIHPTKSQVKFVDASLAFRAVQASIRDTLEKAPWLPQESMTSAVSSKNFNNELAEATDGSVKSTPLFADTENNLKFIDPILTATHFQKKSFETDPQWTSSNSLVPLQEKKQEYLTQDFNVNFSANKMGYWSSLQVLGQAQQTYIIAQKEDRLIFIDQHAAHERVVFEKLMHGWKYKKNLQIQNFLFPLAVDLSLEQVEALLKFRLDFESMGIIIESLGPTTIGVQAAPNFLKESALIHALNLMSEEILQQGESFKIEKTISDIFASMACHSVVRAGQALSLEQMRALLYDMDQYPLSSFCPHGRPVSVEYLFSEMEKDFGRRV